MVHGSDEAAAGPLRARRLAVEPAAQGSHRVDAYRDPHLARLPARVDVPAGVLLRQAVDLRVCALVDEPPGPQHLEPAIGVVRIDDDEREPRVVLEIPRLHAPVGGVDRDAVVVSYVNTTAEVKAESDYCCTSGNAKGVIESIPEDTEILFLPDMFLGLWLEKVTGRKLRIWMGECHVHAGIRPQDITRWQAEAPDAEFLVHPECGCASQCMAFGNEKTHILSTEGMINFARSSPKERFLVATETGIIHRLNKEAPEKRFEAVSEKAICRYMKMITLEKLRDSLRDLKEVVTVPEETAVKARLALERMVQID